MTSSGYRVSAAGDEKVLDEEVLAVVAVHTVNIATATELYTLKCLPLTTVKFMLSVFCYNKKQSKYPPATYIL